MEKGEYEMANIYNNKNFCIMLCFMTINFIFISNALCVDPPIATTQLSICKGEEPPKSEQCLVIKYDEKEKKFIIANKLGNNIDIKLTGDLTVSGVDGKDKIKLANTGDLSVNGNATFQNNVTIQDVYIKHYAYLGGNKGVTTSTQGAYFDDKGSLTIFGNNKKNIKLENTGNLTVAEELKVDGVAQFNRNNIILDKNIQLKGDLAVSGPDGKDNIKLAHTGNATFSKDVNIENVYVKHIAHFGGNEGSTTSFRGSYIDSNGSFWFYTNKSSSGSSGQRWYKLYVVDSGEAYGDTTESARWTYIK